MRNFTHFTAGLQHAADGPVALRAEPLPVPLPGRPRSRSRDPRASPRRAQSGGRQRRAGGRGGRGAGGGRGPGGALRRGGPRGPRGAARGAARGAGPAAWRRARWRPEARRAPPWGRPESGPAPPAACGSPARRGPAPGPLLPAPRPAFSPVSRSRGRASGGSAARSGLPPKRRCLQTQLLRCICNAKDGAASEGRRIGRGPPGIGRAGRRQGPSALPAAIVSASCETSRAFGAGLAGPPGSERSAGRGRAAARRRAGERPAAGKARPAALSPPSRVPGPQPPSRSAAEGRRRLDGERRRWAPAAVSAPRSPFFCTSEPDPGMRRHVFFPVAIAPRKTTAVCSRLPARSVSPRISPRTKRSLFPHLSLNRSHVRTATDQTR